MSRGFGTDAVLETQNDKIAVYRYGNYNLNLEEYRNPEHIMDGMIRVEKSALPEPEIYKKIEHLLRTRQIKIENSRFRWAFLDNPHDLMVIKLLCKISNEYQLTGSMPEHIGLMY